MDLAQKNNKLALLSSATSTKKTTTNSNGKSTQRTVKTPKEIRPTSKGGYRTLDYSEEHFSDPENNNSHRMSGDHHKSDEINQKPLKKLRTARPRVDCWNNANARSAERKQPALEGTPSQTATYNTNQNCLNNGVTTPLSYQMVEDNRHNLPFSAQQNQNALKQPQLTIGATEFATVPINSCNNRSLGRIYTGNGSRSGTPKETHKTGWNAAPSIVKNNGTPNNAEIRSPFSTLSNQNGVKSPSALNLNKQSSVGKKRSARMGAMAAALANPVQNKQLINNHRESQESSTHQRSKSNTTGSKSASTQHKIKQIAAIQTRKAATNTNNNHAVIPDLNAANGFQTTDQDLALKAQKFFLKIEELKESMQLMTEGASNGNEQGSQTAQRRAKVKQSQFAEKKFKKAMKELDAQFDIYKQLYQGSQCAAIPNNNGIE